MQWQLYVPDKAEAAVWQRTSWEATKTKLELAVDVGKNKCKVLNWMARNSNTICRHRTIPQSQLLLKQRYWEPHQRRTFSYLPETAGCNTPDLCWVRPGWASVSQMCRGRLKKWPNWSEASCFSHDISSFQKNGNGSPAGVKPAKRTRRGKQAGSGCKIKRPGQALKLSCLNGLGQTKKWSSQDE